MMFKGRRHKRSTKKLLAHRQREYHKNQTPEQRQHRSEAQSRAALKRWARERESGQFTRVWSDEQKEHFRKTQTRVMKKRKKTRPVEYELYVPRCK